MKWKNKINFLATVAIATTPFSLSSYRMTNQNYDRNEISSVDITKTRLNFNDWMKYVDGRKPLSHLSIPGTHDSAMFSGSGFYWLVGQAWAKTQSRDFTQQLKEGIRFFDIRIASDMWIYHGKAASNSTFEQYISQMASFLSNHPSETIIIRVKDENENISRMSEKNRKEWANKIETVWNRFNRFLFKNETGNPSINPTLDQLRGKMFIINNMHHLVVDKDKRYGTYWRSPNMIVQDEYDTEENIKLNLINIVMDESNRGDYKNWLHINFTTRSKNGSKPYQTAPPINQKVYEKFNRETNLLRTGISVFDHPGDALIEKIIKTNYTYTQAELENTEWFPVRTLSFLNNINEGEEFLIYNGDSNGFQGEATVISEGSSQETKYNLDFDHTNHKVSLDGYVFHKNDQITLNYYMKTEDNIYYKGLQYNKGSFSFRARENEAFTRLIQTTENATNLLISQLREKGLGDSSVEIKFLKTKFLDSISSIKAIRLPIRENALKLKSLSDFIANNKDKWLEIIDKKKDVKTKLDQTSSLLISGDYLDSAPVQTLSDKISRFKNGYNEIFENSVYNNNFFDSIYDALNLLTKKVEAYNEVVIDNLSTAKTEIESSWNSQSQYQWGKEQYLKFINDKKTLINEQISSIINDVSLSAIVPYKESAISFNNEIKVYYEFWKANSRLLEQKLNEATNLAQAQKNKLENQYISALNSMDQVLVNNLINEIDQLNTYTKKAQYLISQNNTFINSDNFRHSQESKRNRYNELISILVNNFSSQNPQYLSLNTTNLISTVNEIESIKTDINTHWANIQEYKNHQKAYTLNNLPNLPQFKLNSYAVQIENSYDKSSIDEIVNNAKTENNLNEIETLLNSKQHLNSAQKESFRTLLLASESQESYNTTSLELEQLDSLMNQASSLWEQNINYKQNPNYTEASSSLQSNFSLVYNALKNIFVDNKNANHIAKSVSGVIENFEKAKRELNGQEVLNNKKAEVSSFLERSILFNETKALFKQFISSSNSVNSLNNIDNQINEFLLSYQKLQNISSANSHIYNVLAASFKNLNANNFDKYKVLFKNINDTSDFINKFKEILVSLKKAQNNFSQISNHSELKNEFFNFVNQIDSLLASSHKIDQDLIDSTTQQISTFATNLEVKEARMNFETELNLLNEFKNQLVNSKGESDPVVMKINNKISEFHNNVASNTKEVYENQIPLVKSFLTQMQLENSLNDLDRTITKAQEFINNNQNQTNESINNLRALVDQIQSQKSSYNSFETVEQKNEYLKSSIEQTRRDVALTKYQNLKEKVDVSLVNFKDKYANNSEATFVTELEQFLTDIDLKIQNNPSIEQIISNTNLLNQKYNWALEQDILLTQKDDEKNKNLSILNLLISKNEELLTQMKSFSNLNSNSSTYESNINNIKNNLSNASNEDLKQYINDLNVQYASNEILILTERIDQWIQKLSDKEISLTSKFTQKDAIVKKISSKITELNNLKENSNKEEISNALEALPTFESEINNLENDKDQALSNFNQELLVIEKLAEQITPNNNFISEQLVSLHEKFTDLKNKVKVKDELEITREISNLQNLKANVSLLIKQSSLQKTLNKVNEQLHLMSSQYTNIEMFVSEIREKLEQIASSSFVINVKENLIDENNLKAVNLISEIQNKRLHLEAQRIKNEALNKFQVEQEKTLALLEQYRIKFPYLNNYQNQLSELLSQINSELPGYSGEALLAKAQELKNENDKHNEIQIKEAFRIQKERANDILEKLKTVSYNASDLKDIYDQSVNTPNLSLTKTKELINSLDNLSTKYESVYKELIANNTKKQRQLKVDEIKQKMQELDQVISNNEIYNSLVNDVQSQNTQLQNWNYEPLNDSTFEEEYRNWQTVFEQLENKKTQIHAEHQKQVQKAKETLNAILNEFQDIFTSHNTSVEDEIKKPFIVYFKQVNLIKDQMSLNKLETEIETAKERLNELKDKIESRKVLEKEVSALINKINQQWFSNNDFVDLDQYKQSFRDFATLNYQNMQKERLQEIKTALISFEISNSNKINSIIMFRKKLDADFRLNLSEVDTLLEHLLGFENSPLIHSFKKYANDLKTIDVSKLTNQQFNELNVMVKKEIDKIYNNFTNNNEADKLKLISTNKELIKGDNLSEFQKAKFSEINSPQNEFINIQKLNSDINAVNQAINNLQTDSLNDKQIESEKEKASQIIDAEKAQQFTQENKDLNNSMKQLREELRLLDQKVQNGNLNSTDLKKYQSLKGEINLEQNMDNNQIQENIRKINLFKEQLGVVSQNNSSSSKSNALAITLSVVLGLLVPFAGVGLFFLNKKFGWIKLKK
ncbi:hypothetical protein VO56_02810 [Mycoplasmopsis gallinacea]|uniref:1-phosphatidylinositol phosphodiesterase n=1 Tax=Mycoplasmopsis gallinacea TaxID=29556 RepID=A0A0D5ZK98_9BACT|nr:hypothetical protein VO56_02810 [Mycoplasmopsis gallinacea]